jgi:hypothetical protein
LSLGTPGIDPFVCVPIPEACVCCLGRRLHGVACQTGLLQAPPGASGASAEEEREDRERAAAEARAASLALAVLLRLTAHAGARGWVQGCFACLALGSSACASSAFQLLQLYCQLKSVPGAAGCCSPSPAVWATLLLLPPEHCLAVPSTPRNCSATSCASCLSREVITEMNRVCLVLFDMDNGMFGPLFGRPPQDLRFRNALSRLPTGCVEALAEERAVGLALWHLHRPPSQAAATLSLRFLQALSATAAAAWGAAAQAGALYLLSRLLPTSAPADEDRVGVKAEWRRGRQR